MNFCHVNQHELSVGHVFHEEIMEMLKKPDATLQNIGDRIGVTRERTRQIIEKMFPGQEVISKRVEDRTFARYEARFRKHLQKWEDKPLIVALKKQCAVRGISFFYGGGTGSIVTLNGKVCRIRKGYSGSVTSKSPDRYMRAGGCPKDGRGEKFFVIWDPIVLTDWWIIPIEYFKPTSWSRAKNPHPYYLKRIGNRKLSKYGEFLNAWHLLKENSDVSGQGAGNKPKVQNTASGNGQRKRQGAGFSGQLIRP